MSDAKFTKGEWFVYQGRYRWCRGKVCVIEADDIPTVVSDVNLYFDEPERISNAHLIAAAPEMYKLLEKLKVVVDDYDYDLFCNRAVGKWSQPDISTDIDNLLAKARGEK